MPAPDKIGHFKILKLINKGGQAPVYLVENTLTHQQRALKVLEGPRKDNADAVRRFMSEAAKMSELHHPHIVPIYSAGEVGGMRYIEMAYLPGGSLKDKLREWRAAGQIVPIEAALKIVRQIADALNYAHTFGAGIIHRDIKPDNVLLAADGRYVLTDFGIARGRDDTATGTSSFLGTPDYMSPEQCQGVRVDARSDLYSLGVMLFELLAGRLPFLVDSSGTDQQRQIAMVTKHVKDVPPRSNQFRPDVPPEVDELVDTLLSKDPNDRVQTAGELIRQLDGLLGGPPPVLPILSDAPLATTMMASTQQASQQPMRRIASVIIAGIIVIVLIIGIGVGAFSGVIPQPAPSTSTFTPRIVMLTSPVPTNPSATSTSPAVAARSSTTLPSLTATLSPTPEQTMVPTTTQIEVAASILVTVPAGSTINMRTGPDLSYPLVIAIPAGLTATVTGKNSDSSWLQVQFGDQAGWVSKAVVKVDPIQLDGVSVVPTPLALPTRSRAPNPPPYSCQAVKILTPRNGDALGSLIVVETYELVAGWQIKSELYQRGRPTGTVAVVTVASGKTRYSLAVPSNTAGGMNDEPYQLYVYIVRDGQDVHATDCIIQVHK